MSQNSLRSNLSAAKFPLLSGKMGRSIILPQYDENYDRTVQASSADELGKGIPQVYYMHNVMPTPEGFQSVGFIQRVPGVAGVSNFDQAIALRDGSDNNFIYSPGYGNNYIFNAMLGAWQSTNPFASGAVYNKTNISYCFLQGNHYLCIQGQGVYQYNSSTNQLTAVTFTGLVMANIKGICTSSGYLICYDNTTMYWSSVINPLDFVPSLTTGAGSGTPTDLKGMLVTGLQIAGGIVAYSTQNAVSAQYTGNIRFPFVFKEVVGSGGIQNSEQVSYLANFSEHYALTSSGVQKIDRNQAVSMFDDVTDFLSANFYEDFDTSTFTFTETKLSKALSTKIALISDRYLVISYGTSVGSFSYALVYDMALKRWGKLKIAHVDSFEYNWPNLFGTVSYAKLSPRAFNDLTGTAYKDISNQQKIAPIARTSLAFIQANGAVWTVDMTEQTQAFDSVFIIGKYQQSRNRVFTIHTAEFDNLYTAFPYAAYALISLDGKNNQPPIVGALLNSAANTAFFGFRATGVNASLAVIGTFSLNTIVVNFTKHGQR